MPNFLRRSKKESSTDLLRKSRGSGSYQRQLEAYKPPPAEEKKLSVVQATSTREVENEVSDYLKDFESYVKQVKEISLELEELAKLSKSGEVPESAYRLIMDELGSQLSSSVDNIFRLRGALELARAKAKLEWAKEKVSTPTLPVASSAPTNLQPIWTTRARTEATKRVDWMAPEVTPTQRIYSLDLQKWEEVISKIDRALSSLPIEGEAAVIEQYLSMIKEKLPFTAQSEEIEKAISICQQRLDSISERWALIRRSKIEQIMNLELEAGQLKDRIKENEVRFSVAELDQPSFEHEVNSLQGNLKKVEKEISDIRSYIDDMDMKIFRSSELLRETQ